MGAIFPLVTDLAMAPAPGTLHGVDNDVSTAVDDVVVDEVSTDSVTSSKFSMFLTTFRLFPATEGEIGGGCSSLTLTASSASSPCPSSLILLLLALGCGSSSEICLLIGRGVPLLRSVRLGVCVVGFMVGVCTRLDEVGRRTFAV